MSEVPQRRTLNEKYGEKIFTLDYKAAVVLILNTDNSWDYGFDGGLIECTGLVHAAMSNMDEQAREEMRKDAKRKREDPGDPD